MEIYFSQRKSNRFNNFKPTIKTTPKEKILTIKRLKSYNQLYGYTFGYTLIERFTYTKCDVEVQFI